MNYKTLESSYNGLSLTPLLQDTDQLKTLEKWCYQHISRDVRCNDKDNNKKYNFYKTLAENYINFTKVLPKDLDSQVAELNGLNPIQYAATHGYDRYIESFKHSNITLDTIINAYTINNMTALHIAAVKGHLYTTQALISLGANPNLVNQSEQLPLHCALMIPALCSQDNINKKMAVFNVLRDLVPKELFHKDVDGQTVFHLMALHPGLETLLAKMLQHYPAGAMDANNHAHTPVHVAILQNNIAGVRLLLKNPDVAKLKDARNRTPLHYAAAYGSADMVTLCKLHTADSEARDKEGLTPLELASKRENNDAMEILNTPACH